MFDKTTIKSGKSVSATSGGLYSDSNSFATDYIYIKGIQKLRGNGSSASANTNRLWGAFYDENKSYISGLDAISKAITVPNNAYYVRFGVLTTYLDTFMLCIGETVPEEYITHKSQILPLTLGNIELCKIGDYQDYFYKESNKWYLHKEIGKYIVTGQETWLVQGTNNEKLGAYASAYPALNIGSANTTNQKCSHMSICERYIGSEHTFFVESDNIRIRNEWNFTTTSEAQSEFQSLYESNTPLTFYYQLATATNTEITDTTLISQLEAINNALSYEEQTNISSNTIALFNVEAYQSTKLVLEERDAKYESLEARVALLE